MKPASWYYRAALRQAKSKQEAIKLGLMLVEELEILKTEMRDHGLIPPRRYLPHQIVPEDERQGLLAFGESAAR